MHASGEAPSRGVRRAPPIRTISSAYALTGISILAPSWGAGALGSMVMVLRIQGCGRQKYQYTPGSWNVKLKLWPAARSPESHTWLSEVVVWTVGPWFVQVMVVPGGTATPKRPGLKAKSTIVTALTDRAAEGTV